jgi:hypothetical protein
MSTVTESKTKRVSLAAAALVFGLAATPALADNDRHRGGWSNHHHGHHKHHMQPGHAHSGLKGRHHHHGYYAPVYVYAPPPPVVYVPAHPVHHAPQPGVTIVFSTIF